jgi:hypothetical protein
MKKTLMLSAALVFFFTFVTFSAPFAQQSPKGVVEGPWPVYAITYGNGNIYTSVDAQTWTLKNSGTNMPLHALTFGNNIFVAVGAAGTIVTGSRDGLKWTPVKTAISDDLWSVTYAKNLFIAVGANGTVIISPDGYKWTKTAVLSPGQTLKNIVYGYRDDDYFRTNGYFITITDTGTIFRSYDGLTWENEYMRYANKLASVIFVNDLFVAIGTNGRVMTSPIGFGEWLSWFDRYSTTMEHLYSITYGGGRYVTVGANGTIMISDDLSRWKVVESGTKSHLSAAAYGRGKFIVVGLDGTILTSSDGENWSLAIKK